MDTPVFDLPINGTAPNQYATEAGLEARLNAALEGVQGNVENYGRHGWTEDLSSTTGGNAIVGTRRAAFADRPVYETGKKYIFRAPVTNTGPVTMQIGIIPGDVEPPLPVLDADGEALEAGELVAGRYYTVRCGADVTRNYRLVGESIPAKERRNLIETTGVIALANVSGRNAITADLPPEAVGITTNRTGIVYRLTVGGGNTSRTMSLKIGDGPVLPIRAMDGSLPKIGDTKTDGTYMLRLYGPANTDPHFRLIAGVDRVGSGGSGSLPEPVDGFEIAVPGDYPDLQEAYDAALWIRAGWVNIEIASGHLLTKGLRADGASAAHIKITYAGTGAVKLAPGFVGADNTDADPLVLSAVYRSASNLFVFNGGSAPTIACLFDMEHKDGNGYAGVNVQSQVEPNCGVINAGRAGFVQQGGSAHALYSKFGGAGGEGARIQQGCSGSFQGANVDGSQSIPAISSQTSISAFYSSRASSMQFQDGSAKNSGGHGVGCHRCWLSATNADISGAALRGVEVSHGGRIVLNGADISDAGEYAIAVGGGGGVLVNANGANLKGAGIASLYLTEGGSIVSLWGAMTNSTAGTWVRGNTYVPKIEDVADYDDATNPISFNFPGYRGLILANVSGPLEGLRGGATGQVLAKLSGDDFDFEWQDQSGGGGGVPTSRTITAGSAYVTGGGNLTANRTFDLSSSSKAAIDAALTAVQPAALAAAIATAEPLHGFVSWSTATRSLDTSDNRARMRVTHATPTLTILAQASEAYDDDTLVTGSSDHALTISGAAGVTINGDLAGSVIIPARAEFSIQRDDEDEWTVTGEGIAIGSGAVDSVNGQTGVVELGYIDVGAQRGIYVQPEDFSGSTESKLNAARAAAISEAFPLWLGGAYSITSALTTVSLTSGQRLDVQGTGSITIAADVARPILIEAVLPAPTAVSALSLTTATVDGGASATEVTVITSAGHGLAVGDLVKLLADDAIPGEINTSRRVGEFFRVVAVSGNDVTLGARPIETFSTGIRVQKMNRGASFSWDGPSLRHTANQAWQVNALTLRNIVGAKVKARFFDGYDCGLQTQSCPLARVEIYARDMLNRISSQGISGYGYQDCGGWLTRVIADGENARHFYTTGTLTASTGDASYLYGRTVGANISGDAIGTTGAAYDLHSSAYGCTLRDVSATGSTLGEDSAGAAYQLRGRFNRIVDGTGTATQHGVSLWAQAAGDGHHLEVVNFQYTGPGDAIRTGSEGTGIKLKHPKVIGGKFSVGDNIRTMYLRQADIADIRGCEIAPTGSATGSCAVRIGVNVDVAVVAEVTLDLTDFTGANYDLIAFDSGITAGKVILVAPEIIDPNGRLRSYVNGSGATGVEVEILGLPEDITPSGGVTINDAGLTVTIRKAGTPALDDIIALIDAAVADGNTDLGESIASALSAYNPDILLTPDTFVTAAEDAASDASVKGPAFGGAISAALATMSEADLLLMQQAIANRMGRKIILEPATGVSEGDVLIAGATLPGSANLRGLSGVAPAIITPLANSFPRVNASSLVEYLSAPAIMTLLEAGLPFASTAVTPVSNVLSYDAYAIRRAYVASALSANIMLNPSIWNATLDRMWDAELTLRNGGTDRTLDVGAVLGTQLFPGDSMIPQFGDGITLPFTIPADSVVSLAIGRRMGGIPMLGLARPIGYLAAAPVVSYIGAATPAMSGGTGTRTIPAGDMPAHQAGDLILAFAYNAGASATPAMAGYTPVAGIGGDGLPGGVLVAWKIATSSAESPAATGGATQLHALAFRKAGSSPQVQAAVAFNRMAYADAACTWGAFTIANNNSLAVGINGFASTDTYDAALSSPLRTEIGNPLYSPSTSSRVFIGVTAGLLAAATSWSSQTRARSGNLSRPFTAQLAIY